VTDGLDSPATGAGEQFPMAHAPWFAGGRLPFDPDLETPGEISAAQPGRLHWDVGAVVAAGGALGGLARYGLNELLPRAQSGFPWSTFAENVSGCALLGALMVVLLEVRAPSRYLRPFLAVGVLGGFTTFSAYTAEVRGLLVGGRTQLAMAYLSVSLLAGVLATVAGIALARGLFEPSQVSGRR
jgi:fluoride exporter